MNEVIKYIAIHDINVITAKIQVDTAVTRRGLYGNKNLSITLSKKLIFLSVVCVIQRILDGIWH